MPTTAYYLTVETRERYTAHEYIHKIAGRLANALQFVLQDTQKLSVLTNCTSLSDPRIEVEVVQTEVPQPPDYVSKVAARAVLLTTHPPGKLAFSKNKFTHHMRNALPDIGINVRKQCGESDADKEAWTSQTAGKTHVEMPFPLRTDDSD